MLVKEAGKDSHDRNTAAHRHGGVDRLQTDHIAAFTRRDIAHRRQVAYRKGAAMQDLRDNQPRQLGGPAHDPPAGNAADGREQEQIPGTKAAEQPVTEGKDDHFRHHTQRPEITHGRR